MNGKPDSLSQLLPQQIRYAFDRHEQKASMEPGSLSHLLPQKTLYAVDRYGQQAATEPDSLSQLRPYFTQTTAEHYPSLQPKTPTASQLESMTARILDIVQAGDWTHPDWQNFVAYDFVAKLPIRGLTTSRQAYEEGYEVSRTLSPRLYHPPNSIVAYVDESQQTARVFVLAQLFGNPSPLVRQGVMVYHFALTTQGWKAVKLLAMKGADFY